MPSLFTLMYAAAVAAAGAGFVVWMDARRRIYGPESPWMLVGFFVIVMGFLLGILDRFIGHLTVFADDGVLNTLVVTVSLPAGMFLGRGATASRKAPTADTEDGDR